MAWEEYRYSRNDFEGNFRLNLEFWKEPTVLFLFPLLDMVNHYHPPSGLVSDSIDFNVHSSLAYEDGQVDKSESKLYL